MMVLGPTLIVLFFVTAFILWIKFISLDKPVKVIREEQLFNRNKQPEYNPTILVNQRDPVRRQHKSSNRYKEENEDYIVPGNA